MRTFWHRELFSEAVLSNLTWRGPAKSTPVKVKGGSCCTLNTGSGGLGPMRSLFAPFANNALVNTLHHKGSALDNPKLGPNFSVSFTPLCRTLECARLTTSVVKWCCLGNRIRCLTQYEIYALDRHPPHLQTPPSSKKRPNCPFSLSK